MRADIEPCALRKANALIRHIRYLGATDSDYLLCLSTQEGLELLDWLIVQNAPNELLDLDVEEAKRLKNPWPVLEHFVLLGLSMAPLTSLN